MLTEFTTFLRSKIPELEASRRKYHWLRRIGNIVIPILNFVFKAVLVLFFVLVVTIPFVINAIVGDSTHWMFYMVFFTLLAWGALFAGTYGYIILTGVVLTKLNELLAESIGEKIKATVFPQLFSMMNPTYTYNRYIGLNAELFRKMALFKSSSYQHEIHFEGEDAVTGTVEGVDFLMAEMVAMRRIRLMSVLNFIEPLFLLVFVYLQSFKFLKENVYVTTKGRYYKKFFRGIFLQADFNKEFSGRVLICPKGVLNRYNFLSNTDGMETVLLDNGMFNDEFVVYATQKGTAFYVISPSIIDLVLSLKEKHGLAPIVSFNDGKITVLFPGDKDYFIYDNETRITDVSYFDKTIVEIRSYDEVIQLFGLHNKIWTKV